MNTFKRVGLIIIVAMWVVYFGSCDALDPYSQRNYTYHTISISNDTNEPIFVEVISVWQVLDTLNGASNLESKVLDSAYQLLPNATGALYNYEQTRRRRQRLYFDEMIENIIYLRVYKVEGTDTLEADILLSDYYNWLIQSDEPIYSGHTYHDYNLLIVDSMFD